jgi:hypothetical protein
MTFTLDIEETSQTNPSALAEESVRELLVVVVT